MKWRVTKWKSQLGIWNDHGTHDTLEFRKTWVYSNPKWVLDLMTELMKASVSHIHNNFCHISTCTV